ncbi:sulfite exporter TauE/SafE family protein [Tenacibaculum aestuariivivum]|uniref:sulfite exporter TauE/SafE family protein n=1 Tax=Tenacibaculum aestuariivivum TaxID=2006131 RepID=UPI003AB866FC
MNFQEIILLLNTNWHIIVLFFIIAILYSSVGFGGGSSYLAVLALTGLIFTQIRATSLLCNIMVVTGNFFYFEQQKAYNFKKVIPLVLFSIPFAFIGGYLKISQTFFFILLGLTLLFASITMWVSKKNNASNKKPVALFFLKNAGYGSFIGFISGMVGVGGGIFLAPLLHLTNWDSSKKIAATASLFILVNSIAGLAGQYLNPEFSINYNLTTILLFTVFLGGQIGSRLSYKFLNPIQLKKATAILIAFVAIKILWNYV